jgi:hypothetical protein
MARAEDDAISEVKVPPTAAAVGKIVNDVISSVAVEAGAAGEVAEAAILFATSAALIEGVGAVESDITIILVTTLGVLTSWTAKLEVVEATAGSLDKALPKAYDLDVECSCGCHRSREGHGTLPCRTNYSRARGKANRSYRQSISPISGRSG